MRVDFVSLFPEVLSPFVGHSILGRAAEKGLVEFRAVNPRDFTYDRHGKVDDVPFGGHAGMLIKPEPVALALEALGHEGAAVILTDPAAPLFWQGDARALAGQEHLIFLCGHYEGFDHRVKTRLATHSFSIGDFVLTNGEMPALVMADAVIRQLPAVLGSEQSLEADSFADGLLSAPNFTRPETWRGEAVPEVLRSGNHENIRRWRRRESLRITAELRPDLLSRAKLSKKDLELLAGEDP